MNYYKCEKCGKVFDEFEMNFKAAQIDKLCWCNECRQLNYDNKSGGTTFYARPLS